MKHPPYHLRPNKAVDRLIFVDIINLIAGNDISKYVYYGFGGPFLEDFRLLSSYFPSTKLISIETNQQTYKRQVFHKPSSKIVLKNKNFSDYLSECAFKGKSIVWLDYTGLEYRFFNDFIRLIQKVNTRSIIKITVNANFLEAKNNIKEFKRDFDKVLPPGEVENDVSRLKSFVVLLQNMFRISSEKALPAHTKRKFYILHSSYYNDGTPMYTITGTVCDKEDSDKILKLFEEWKFKNLDWSTPQSINVPDLSIKERLFLEELLPMANCTGKELEDALSYKIDSTRTNSRNKLKQYGEYYCHYPLFGKILM